MLSKVLPWRPFAFCLPRFPSEFILDSDSAALMYTPVPLCMYTCTWFQVLGQVYTLCRHVSVAAILFFAFMLFSIPSIRSDLCVGGASREVVVRFPVPWVLHIVNYLLIHQFVAGAVRS